MKLCQSPDKHETCSATVDASYKYKSSQHCMQKESQTNNDIMKIFELDFIERNYKEATVPQDKLFFLAKLKKCITRKQNVHFEMVLFYKRD